MNARQKAKYYKRKCEQLEKLTLPLKRPPFEVQRVRNTEHEDR